MKIEVINIIQAKKIKKELEKKNIFIGEINGKKINTLEDYMNVIIKEFNFPENVFKNIDSIDAYNDWMTDLSWLEDYEGYAIFIYNLKHMLNMDSVKKEIILNNFDEVIVPFWTNDIEKIVVGGEKKEFLLFDVKRI